MKKKSDWLRPLGLVLLTIVPSIAGAMRAGGSPRDGVRQMRTRPCGES
jgi:hypothetical protein